MQDKYDIYTSMKYCLNVPQFDFDDVIKSDNIMYTGFEKYCLNTDLGHLEREVCASKTLDRIYCVALYHSSHVRLSELLAKCAYITLFASCFVDEYSNAIAAIRHDEPLASIYERVLLAAKTIKRSLEMNDPIVSDQEFSVLLDNAF